MGFSFTREHRFCHGILNYENLETDRGTVLFMLSSFNGLLHMFYRSIAILLWRMPLAVAQYLVSSGKMIGPLLYRS